MYIVLNDWKIEYIKIKKFKILKIGDLLDFSFGQTACTYLFFVSMASLWNFDTELKRLVYILSLRQWMFLKPIYFRTNAFRDKIHSTHIKTPTCFDTLVPFSGNYYNKSARANLLIYVLFVTISLITLVVKIHKIY